MSQARAGKQGETILSILLAENQRQGARFAEGMHERQDPLVDHMEITNTGPSINTWCYA
jgi:hypothetical protein